MLASISFRAVTGGIRTVHNGGTPDNRSRATSSSLFCLPSAPKVTFSSREVGQDAHSQGAASDKEMGDSCVELSDDNVNGAMNPGKEPT